MLPVIYECWTSPIQAQQALTDAERDRAERAEAQLETERTDHRQLNSHLAASASAKRPAPVSARK